MASTWDDICKSVDGFTKKMNRKAEQLSESAAIRLKISAKKAELEDAYLALGKLVYESAAAALKTEEQAPDTRIDEGIAGIKALLAEIEALQAKIDKNSTPETEA